MGKTLVAVCPTRAGLAPLRFSKPDRRPWVGRGPSNRRPHPPKGAGGQRKADGLIVRVLASSRQQKEQQKQGKAGWSGDGGHVIRYILEGTAF